MKTRLLIINFGSTSTKIAVYDNDVLFLEETFRHDPEFLLKFDTSISQKEFRKNTILNFVEENNYDMGLIDIYVGRGGLIAPIEGGTYIINEEMIEDLTSMKYGDHVSNLGSIIAYELAEEYGKKAYTVNPVVVDELSDFARISGLKGIERKSIFHALNHKAVANRYAKSINKKYTDLNLIVVHLGGGISVALHEKGKVVDVNNALGGEGPFSPSRSGTLPVSSIIDYWNENRHLTNIELKRMLVTKGGLYSYIGTGTGIEISARVKQNDEEAIFYCHAMSYQINKQIGSLYFAAQGDVDAVIFTGGLAYQEHLRERLTSLLIPGLKAVFYPGEDELSALAEGALRVLNNEEEVKHYQHKD